MHENKKAQADHPLHEHLANRFSPYAYDDRAVSRADLDSLFEAARWAASSFNEQPWRYIVATQDNTEEFEKMLSCLVERNREWARRAYAVALGVASTSFARNGKPNRHALHDLGAATAGLTFQATHLGLAVHQMAGILPDVAREVFQIPDDYDVATAFAIGYAAAGDDAPAELRKRDTMVRSRRPIEEFVFSGTFGTPLG